MKTGGDWRWRREVVERWGKEVEVEWSLKVYLKNLMLLPRCSGGGQGRGGMHACGYVESHETYLLCKWRSVGWDWGGSIEWSVVQWARGRVLRLHISNPALTHLWAGNVKHVTIKDYITGAWGNPCRSCFGMEFRSGYHHQWMCGWVGIIMQRKRITSAACLIHPGL